MNENKLNSPVPQTAIEERKKKNSSTILIKIIILNLINLILISAIFYLSGQMPQLSENLKKFKSEQFAKEGQNDVLILQSEIERNQDKIGKLDGFIADEDGLVDFVATVNNWKNEEILTDFTLTDSLSTGRNIENGYPVSFVIEGSKEKINTGLNRIYGLPYLFKVTGAELEPSGENSIYRLNIILLVDGEITN